MFKTQNKLECYRQSLWLVSSCLGEEMDLQGRGGSEDADFPCLFSFSSEVRFLLTLYTQGEDSCCPVIADNLGP